MIRLEYYCGLNLEEGTCSHEGEFYADEEEYRERLVNKRCPMCRQIMYQPDSHFKIIEHEDKSNKQAVNR